MKVKYKFQSLDEKNQIVGNKDKIYEIDLKDGEKPNLINCIETTLFDILKNDINSSSGIRDIMMEAEQLALKTTYFEILEVIENVK